MYWHDAAGALGSGCEHTQICILRERSDRLAASEASLAVACERSEASVTASKEYGLVPVHKSNKCCLKQKSTVKLYNGVNVLSFDCCWRG